MITFLTLFLGLTLGVQPIELAVSAPVASVEVRLDGRPAAVLEGEPWRLAVDFGGELAPHHLMAVALDERGREIGRAEQWVNRPRDPAEAVISLEEAGPGRRRARLGWQSVVGAEPLAVRWELDGEPLPAPDPRVLELPPLDLRRLHFLRAELDFENGVTAGAEATFGGEFEEAVRADLTAVPVIAEDGRLPGPEGLADFFLAAGRPVEAVAVEEGPADLVMVVSPGSQAAVRRMALTWHQPGRPRRALGPGALDAQKTAMPLKKSQRLRLLWPYAAPQQGVGQSFDVFLPSGELTSRDGGVFWLLQWVRPGFAVSGAPRLADAVAVAGLLAAQMDRRRAVVLLLAGAPSDAGGLSPALARRYLERLRVPFEVWTFDPEAAAGGWGEAVDVSSAARLEAAVRRLTRGLDRQRLVWLAGRHLPQEIGLAPGARGLRLAAAAAGAKEVASRAAAAPRTGEMARPLPGPRTTRSGSLAEALRALEDGEAPEVWEDDERQERLEQARRLLGAEETSLGPWVLLTDLDDGETLAELSRRAASLPEAYRRRTGLTPSPPQERETVLLFRREKDYRRYEAGEEEIAELGLEGHAGGGLAALSAEGRTVDEVSALLVHELTHLLNRRSLGQRALGRQAPGEELPAWLDEGLADDLAFSRFDRDGRLLPGTLGGRASVRERRLPLGPEQVRIEREWELGGAQAALHRLAGVLEAGRLTPLEELVGLTWREFVAAGGREVHYPQSAFFLRYLLDGGEVPGWRVRGLFAAVAAGAPADGDAVARALGLAWPQLQTGFERWLRAEARRHEVH